MSAYTGPARPNAASNAPTTSIRRSRPPIVSPGHTEIRASTTATSTSGTLTAKIQRQLAASTSQPPTAGPTIVASPPQAAQVPIAAPRSCSSS